MHILDKIALQWEQKEEKFFLDVELSTDYVKVQTPVGKNYAWQVENHDILKSKNLESIFDAHYNDKKEKEFVPLFDMISKMFGSDSFAPPELDLGVVILYSEAKFTDVISGIEGNFGNRGWIISKRFFKILKKFNIGEYQHYKIVVKNKKEKSSDYVYLHFISYADDFVDYPASKFYKQKGGSLQFDTRELIEIKSAKDIQIKEDKLNEGIDWADFDNKSSIAPKELFLKNNDLDFFRFKRLSTIDCFMSVALAIKIAEENITGFKLTRTTKVKDL